MPSFKPSMLNYHDHYYYLVVFITTDACLAEWYPGLRQICGLNCYLFLAEVALVVGFLLLSPPPLLSFLLHCPCCNLEVTRSLCLLNNERRQIVSVSHFVIPEQDTIE